LMSGRLKGRRRTVGARRSLIAESWIMTPRVARTAITAMATTLALIPAARTGSPNPVITVGQEPLFSTHSELEREANPKALKRFAEATGGAAFRPRSVRDVADVLRHIARDIRHTYTIGFVPTNISGDGAFRRVRVIVRSPDGRPVVVRTRTGYLTGNAGERGRP
jgi:VWFA-related protein